MPNKKEYWVEVTSWLNAQKTQMRLHNHAMEFIPFVESESPWDIIHHYCTPEIRFQFDPKNIKDKSEIEEILIKFKNYKKILDDRESSLNRGFLESPSEVNGQIKLGDKIYDAKFRLKGDLYDHWVSNTRLSLRIKLKDGKTIFGMNLAK